MLYEVIDNLTKTVALDRDNRPFVYKSKGRAEQAADRLNFNLAVRDRYTVQPVKTAADTIKTNSSATYKWGILILKGELWQNLGFLKSEKAAKQFAIELGASPVLIARRYEARELMQSRNMG